MEIPQILMMFVLCLDTVFGLTKHGKPREGEHDGMVSFLVNSGLALILYAGGFWSQ